MSTYIFSLYNHPLTDPLIEACELRKGNVLLHRFPDSECLIEIESAIKGQKVILIDSFDRPDNKILPAIFFAQTAKELGASDVGLIATYSPFMRQDARFHEGQSLSAKCYAQLIENYYDWVVIPEPHLHRYHDLNELFTIPAHRLYLNETIGHWIANHVEKPFVVGPDSESRQWAEKVATIAGCDYTVLNKTRHSDTDVSIKTESSVPKHVQVVFVDDIISTGHTLLAAAKALALPSKPIVVGIHALFAQNAFQLLETVFARIVTTNTIPHKSNHIDAHTPMANMIRVITT